MKATIDLPDDLYRRAKARAALMGLTVREVTIELYRQWLGDAPGAKAGQSPEQWLDEWQGLGSSLLEDAPEGPTASDIIAADRNRLES
jgi:hypothetical protein